MERCQHLGWNRCELGLLHSHRREVKTEYAVVIPVKLKVDVVGIKPDKRVAVECGFHVSQPDRFKLLESVFDVVLEL